MANKKVLLKTSGGDYLYPRTSVDNIVSAVGSTTTVTVVVLQDGKISDAYLDGIAVILLSMVATAPTTCAKGDKYFNTSSKKVFTATAANTWGTTGADPDAKDFYYNKADDIFYRWTGSAMEKVKNGITTTTSVRATGSATDGVIPTEKAVRTAITSATGSVVTKLTEGTGITLSGSTGSITVGVDTDTLCGNGIKSMSEKFCIDASSIAGTGLASTGTCGESEKIIIDFGSVASTETAKAVTGSAVASALSGFITYQEIS